MNSLTPGAPARARRRRGGTGARRTASGSASSRSRRAAHPSGNGSVTDLLTLSQVVLALQLPLAMFPLLHFTSSRKRMGIWKSGWFLLAAGWISAILISVLDVYGLPDAMKQAWQVVVGN